MNPKISKADSMFQRMTSTKKAGVQGGGEDVMKKLDIADEEIIADIETNDTYKQQMYSNMMTDLRAKKLGLGKWSRKKGSK